MLSAPLAALAFADNLQHVLRRKELPLLDVDRLAGARDGLDEIGLPAQEGGRLQHVHDRRHFRHMVGFVHIGQHRDAYLALHFGQDAQAFGHPGSAKRCARTAIRLVVGGLEDERDADRGADLLQLACDVDLELAGFDDAGTGDQEQRPVESDVEATQLPSRPS